MDARERVRLSTYVAARIPQCTECDYRLFFPLNDLQRGGDTFVLPPLAYAAWQFERPVRLLTASIPASLISNGARHAGIPLTPDKIRPLHLHDSVVSNLLHALAGGANLCGSARDAYVQPLAAALAIKLALAYMDAGAQRLTPVPDRRIVKVTDYIAAHFAERMSIRQLAQLVNMSESHLKAQFKQTMGTTIHRYIVTTRVQFAMREISSEQSALSDVAHRAGFADQSHMSRWIKRVAGVPPHRLTQARIAREYV